MRLVGACCCGHVLAAYGTEAGAEADVCHAPSWRIFGHCTCCLSCRWWERGRQMQRGRHSQLPLAIKRGPRPLNKAKLLNVSMRFMQRQNGAPQSTHTRTHTHGHTHAHAWRDKAEKRKKCRPRERERERGKSRQGKCKINWQLPLAAAGDAAPRRAAPHCAAADATATACHSNCLPAACLLPAARLAVAYFSGAGQHCCCSVGSARLRD